MKKALLPFLILILWSVVGGMCLQSSPNQRDAEFNLLFAGTPDQYGNQILNVSIAQDVGGVYKTRGVVTSSNYTTGADIYGVINQTTKITGIVALNYSWASNPIEAGQFTDFYLTISGLYTNEPMSLVSVDLVSQSQGWIVEYAFIWDDAGYPLAGSNVIQVKYSATGPSKNYNLTFYDAGFSQTVNYWNNMENVSWDDALNYGINTATDGEENKFLDNEGTKDYFNIREYDFDFDTDTYQFLEIQVTALVDTGATGFFGRIYVNNATSYYEAFTFTEAGVYHVNLQRLLSGSTSTELTFSSGSSTQGDYYNVTYAKAYSFTDYVEGGSNIDKDSYLFLDQGNLNATVTCDDAGNEYLPLTYNPNIQASDSLVIEYAITGSLLIYVYIDYVSLGTDAFALTTTGSWQSYSFDLKDDEIDYLYISFDDSPNSVSSGSHSASIKWVYTEDYGFLNQTLSESGNAGDFEGSTEPIAAGYDGFYYSKPEQDLGSGYWNQSGFQPLDGLGAFTIVNWVWVYAFSSDNDGGEYLDEDTTEYYLLSQYVDSNSQISLLYNESGYFIGRLGNTTHVIEVVNGPHYPNEDLGPEQHPYNLIFQGEKGGTLKLSVNGTMTASSTVFYGAIDAPADLYLLNCNGTFQTSPYVALLESSIYYMNATSTEVSRIFSRGPDYFLSVPYHTYSMNEVSQLGFPSGTAKLHDGLFVTATREQWTLDVNGLTLASYLFPWPSLYPELYIWLAGWVMAPLGLILGIHKGKDADDPFYPFLIGLIICILGVVIVVSGV